MNHWYEMLDSLDLSVKMLIVRGYLDHWHFSKIKYARQYPSYWYFNTKSVIFVIEGWVLNHTARNIISSEPLLPSLFPHFLSSLYCPFLNKDKQHAGCYRYDLMLGPLCLCTNLIWNTVSCAFLRTKKPQWKPKCESNLCVFSAVQLQLNHNRAFLKCASSIVTNVWHWLHHMK